MNPATNLLKSAASEDGPTLKRLRKLAREADSGGSGIDLSKLSAKDRRRLLTKNSGR